MSETPARYVTESEKEKARMIAKTCWYTGRSSLQTLALILEIDEDEVERIIGSDEHLAAIEELIRTRPDRKPVSIEDWWRKEWKHKPSAFAKRRWHFKPWRTLDFSLTMLVINVIIK